MATQQFESAVLDIVAPLSSVFKMPVEAKFQERDVAILTFDFPLGPIDVIVKDDGKKFNFYMCSVHSLIPNDYRRVISDYHFEEQVGKGSHEINVGMKKPPKTIASDVHRRLGEHMSLMSTAHPLIENKIAEFEKRKTEQVKRVKEFSAVFQDHNLEYKLNKINKDLNLDTEITNYHNACDYQVAAKMSGYGSIEITFSGSYEKLKHIIDFTKKDQMPHTHAGIRRSIEGCFKRYESRYVEYNNTKNETKMTLAEAALTKAMDLLKEHYPEVEVTMPGLKPCFKFEDKDYYSIADLWEGYDAFQKELLNEFLENE